MPNQSSKTVYKSSGIGVLGLTFIVFLTLKLAGIGQVATWSWWWVTSPLWLPLAPVIILLIIYVVFMVRAWKK